MAEKFKNKFRIKSARWKDWDYGNNGLYFITICTHQKSWSFGKVSDKGEMIPSGIGLLAHYYWHQISNHFSFVKLEAFVVMPNHIHGVIRIDKPPVETRHCLVSTITPEKHRFRNQGKHTISSIIGSYKSIVTKHARRINPDFAWQARFHDHVIRNDSSYQMILEYIRTNPKRWANDCFRS